MLLELHLRLGGWGENQPRKHSINPILSSSPGKSRFVGNSPSEVMLEHCESASVVLCSVCLLCWLVFNKVRWRNRNGQQCLCVKNKCKTSGSQNTLTYLTNLKDEMAKLLGACLENNVDILANRQESHAELVHYKDLDIYFWVLW